MKSIIFSLISLFLVLGITKLVRKKKEKEDCPIFLSQRIDYKLRITFFQRNIILFYSNGTYSSTIQISSFYTKKKRKEVKVSSIIIQLRIYSVKYSLLWAYLYVKIIRHCFFLSLIFQLDASVFRNFFFSFQTKLMLGPYTLNKASLLHAFIFLENVLPTLRFDKFSVGFTLEHVYFSGV